MKWSIGLTTVPERHDTSLPRTLVSLKAAGFDEPRLFVDGEPDSQNDYHGLDRTCRWPRIGAFGNWILGVMELHLREPNADAYMLVQDDVIFSKNVRQYLERCWQPSLGSTKEMEKKGWLNLYTANQNEQVTFGGQVGWHQSVDMVGQGKVGIHARQVGQGALALCFSNQGVEASLGHPTIISKCRGSKPTTNIDGTVTNAMNTMGWREWCHNPSLVDHIGWEDSIIEKQIEREVKDGKRPHVRQQLPKCMSFRGEQFDAMELLK